VHALCNIKALLTNGLLRIGDQADEPDEAFTAEYVHFSWIIYPLDDNPPRQRREHRVFEVLLQMVPNLEARLMEGVDEDVTMIADLVCHPP
jgi:hypothetical protein